MQQFHLVAGLILAGTGLVSADTCNGDNCLNALKREGTTAISFCNEYTAYPHTAATPTYVPSTCGPQRLSSACYCADNVGNPTYTPAPCPTGQVIANPSFYGQAGSLETDIRPWVIAVPNGQPGCVPAVGYSISDMNGQWGDPRSIECSFQNNATDNTTLAGLSTVTQDIELCPSTQYTFRMSSACDFYLSSGDFGISYRVLLNHQVILTSRKACPICADPSNPDYDPYCREAGGGVTYEPQTATFTSPAGTGTLSLIIEVSQPAGLVGQQVPLLIDQIFINQVGDTSSGDPAGPFGES